MKKQTDFETRIARIQARANGQLPPEPIIAPLVGEEIKPRKNRRGGSRVVLLTLAAAAFAAGTYSTELVAILPPDVVASSEFLTKIANIGPAAPAENNPVAQANIDL